MALSGTGRGVVTSPEGEGNRHELRLETRASWDQIEATALRSGGAIRQEPREGRIGNTVERGDAAGARRNATRRAGVFCVVGSSKGLPVFPIRAAPFSCPRHKIPPAQRFNLALTCSSHRFQLAFNQRANPAAEKSLGF